MVDKKVQPSHHLSGKAWRQKRTEVDGKAQGICMILVLSLSYRLVCACCLFRLITYTWHTHTVYMIHTVHLKLI